MMDNALYPHGSAAFAQVPDVRRAGLLTLAPNALMLGTLHGHWLHFGGQGGLVTVGGARSGKLTSALAYTLLGACWDHSAIYLDVKSECAGISQWAVTQTGRRGIYWSPMNLPGVPGA